MSNKPLDLSDSFARLGWMKRLAGTITAMGDSALHKVARDGFHVKEYSLRDGPRLGMALKDTVEIPTDLGFLVADFVVNGRSCLDMAVNRLVATRRLPWKDKPDFPLVDDINTAKGSASWGHVRDPSKTPEPYRRAIKSMQPQHHPGLDVPEMRTALEIRDLANANKHRNLTPVVAQLNGALLLPVPADTGPRTRSSEWSAWGDGSLHVLQHPSGTAMIRIGESDFSAGVRLLIDGGPDCGYLLGKRPTTGQAVRLPIPLVEFVDRAARFVELALNRLLQADAWHRGPQTDDLLFEFHGSL